MARLARGTRYRPAKRIRQVHRVEGGLVHIDALYSYNTRFPRQWATHPKTLKRWEEYKNAAVATARREVPVDTGRLRDSIGGAVVSEDSTVANNIGIRIELYAGGEDAFYWAFVEYGTGRRGQRSAARSRSDVGTPVGWRYGPKTGRTARPYLRPAMMEIRRRIRRGSGASPY